MKDTAERILDAADEVLGEVGYAGASMRAVAERAGVNKALVFYHFDDKRTLFDRVLERYYASHFDALRGAFEAEASTRARLHRLLDAYVAFMQDNLRYPRLVQQILTSGEPQVDVVKDNLRPLAEWVDVALADLCPERGPLAARQFFVTFSSLVTGYFTYAPVLAATWAVDPVAEAALEERRAHLHWLMDRMLDGLEAEGRAA